MTIRGVNLGGWLVLEPWITPSLFQGTNIPDEYMFSKHATPLLLQKLQHHRERFVTEADFAWLAKQGVQAVRLPVGYWLFGDVSPFVGTLEFVDNAFAWAGKHGLKLMLDLHGAPGSQNGTMHSGRLGAIGWPTTQANIEQTLTVLQRLAERYGQRPELLGIGFLNEPSPKIPVRLMARFYRQAYISLRPLLHADAWLAFSDAFRPWRWFWRLPTQDFPQLYIEYHHYQIFSWLDKLLPARWQLWRTRHALPGRLRRMAAHHPLIIGEWSGALRAEKLPATGREVLVRDYVQAQQRAFTLADCAATFYWTYKTEAGDSWSFRNTVNMVK